MFASSTKPQAANAPISLIARAKQTFGTPVVAIGGITRDNAQRLLDAGVDALAVISDLFDADNDTERVARAKRFLEMFDRRTASGHHPGRLNP
jgi:thiamine-phosphate pyrophosphorylase